MAKMIDQSASDLPRLAPRKAQSHKGDYGRALLVGGSRGMSGAIVLAGKAALRSGAGLVTLAVPHTIQDVVAACEPSYMTVALGDDGERIDRDAMEILATLLPRMTAVALGPGLGRSEGLTALVADCYRDVTLPMVVDADGLNALAGVPDAAGQPGGPRILTPHPGELARLLKLAADDAESAAEDDNRRVELAADLAGRDPTSQTVVVLKGHRTVICDGQRYAINASGNAGMATGGTGDSLTGIITGLLCQGLSAWEAARLAAHVHGRAGDLAAECLGQVSLIASDLVDFLAAAFQEHEM